MAGDIKIRLAREAKILEYWRKRYLLQAFIVAILGIAGIVAVWKYVNLLSGRLFLSLLILVVFYVMYKSLRENLQARGEGLILANGEELFGEMMFDVGRGLCENALLAQEISPPYQVRECRNVMRGKGYWFEEDWFYSVLSSKYIPINQTAFEGVILAFADTQSAEGLKGRVYLKGGKAIIAGDLASRLKQTGASEKVVAFMRLFGATEAEMAVADKMLYVWIGTEKKLFYQFSLFKSNTLVLFQKRIETLRRQAEEMLEVLNC